MVVFLNYVKLIFGSELYIVIQLIGLILFALAGAFFKEFFESYKNNSRIYPFKIIIATVISSTLSFSIKEYFFPDINSMKPMLAVSLIFGIIGFELFTKISSIEGIKSLSADIGIIIKNLIFTVEHLDSKKKDDDKKK